jgi:hypothetical protein
MSTKARKRKAASPGKQRTALRRDVQEAIDRVWLDGTVELSFDSDGSYFCELYPKLSRALHRIRNARLVQEREAGGGPIWWDQSDPEEDPPDEVERSRSYHLFFVSPDGRAFTFETEAESFEEPELVTEESEEAECGGDLLPCRVPGTGRTGWVVAVSLVAPFAVIEFGDVVAFEDGSTIEAAIELYGGTAGGEPTTPEEHFRTSKGAAYKTLVSLRAKISEILEKCGIIVLPAEEWRKPAPWLRGGEDTLMGVEGKAIRVLDAFFFEEL